VRITSIQRPLSAFGTDPRVWPRLLRPAECKAGNRRQRCQRAELHGERPTGHLGHGPDRLSRAPAASARFAVQDATTSISPGHSMSKCVRDRVATLSVSSDRLAARRQLEREYATSARQVAHRDLAAVCFGGLLDDRKPATKARPVLAPLHCRGLRSNPPNECGAELKTQAASCGNRPAVTGLPCSRPARTRPWQESRRWRFELE
jgi:hypothetical protein